ncbi:MAG: hypothetical protein O7D35_06675, partial [Acidobacteria bacterium]|nr:hypothetical protein [Acidobacteriota bacterium]
PAAEIQLIRPGKQPPADPAADADSTLEEEPTAVPEVTTDADPSPGEEPEVAPDVTTLQVGKEIDAESGKRYATVSGFGFAVTLNKFDAERATDKKLADLIVDDSQEE